MAKTCSAVPGVYLIMEKDGHALFLHRNGSAYLDGMHMTPGGGVEPGEPPTVAAAREAAEEIGISVDLPDLTHVHTMYRGAHDATGDRVDIFFKVTKWKGEPINNEPHKCDELVWLPLNNLPESVPLYVRSAIESSEKGVLYSEFDW
jgi:8-oxo-dGTP diphosphatase